ncbi:MAG: presqualene diphosphate synthase HpnD [Alphaproteobacteria bacterium]|nr:MAG: presqualene diphosphate synthase HpnD [Alphaproteobacteria bacterium]
MTPDQKQIDAIMQSKVAAANSSFTAGMKLLPPRQRAAMFALYAFCREVDDIADGDIPTNDPMQALEAWRGHLRGLAQNLPAEPGEPIILTALRGVVVDFGVAVQDLIAIVDGMAMDAAGPILAPDRETLELYCDRVASAVGRASGVIFGAGNGQAPLQVAHHLGRALQKTNILRDLDEDAARGRLYMPRDLLDAHQVTCATPEQALAHPGLDAACRDLAQEARDHFLAADAAMRDCAPRSMRSARLMGAYYRLILKHMHKRGWNAPRVRVGLSRWDKLLLLVRALLS